MSIYPIICILKKNSGENYPLDFSLPEFGEQLTRSNPTNSKPEIRSKFRKGEIEAKIPYKFEQDPHQHYELVTIASRACGRVLIHELTTPNTQLGYDVALAGDEEATLKSEALRATAEVLFDITGSHITVTTNDSDKIPESIEEAIQHLPYSKFSLLRKGLIPDFEKCLLEISNESSLVMDWGDYIELSSGPYPFGITSSQLSDFAQGNSPFMNYKEAVETVLKRLIPDFVSN